MVPPVDLPFADGGRESASQEERGWEQLQVELLVRRASTNQHPGLRASPPSSTPDMAYTKWLSAQLSCDWLPIQSTNQTSAVILPVWCGWWLVMIIQSSLKSMALKLWWDCVRRLLHTDCATDITYALKFTYQMYVSCEEDVSICSSVKNVTTPENTNKYELDQMQMMWLKGIYRGRLETYFNCRSLPPPGIWSCLHGCESEQPFS